MKVLIFIMLAMPVAVAAQEKGYLHGFAGLSRSNEATTHGVVGLSGGLKMGKAFAVGAGVGFIQFEKPYIPLTIDLSLIPTNKKVNPIAGVKAGYGFFNYHPSSTETVRGGFVATAFAGIMLSRVKFKPNITAGATRYTFKSSYQTKTIGTDDKRGFIAIGFLL